MMVSTVVIAVATLIYASLTYFLLREQRREKEKPRIQEIGDVVIWPLIKKLEGQKSSFSKGDFNWTQDGFYYRNHQLAEFHGVEKLIYDDFTKAFPDCLTNIEKYNQELNTQKEILDNFANKIRSSQDFVDEVLTALAEYQKKYLEKDIPRVSFEHLELILGFIVNDKLTLNQGNRCYGFWNIYGIRLSEFRYREELTYDNEEVAKGCKNLLGLADDILENLKAILNNYREKYGIIYKEVERKYSQK